MKMSMIFGLLCGLFIFLYATLFALIQLYPQGMAGLSIFMILFGWGAGAFFILAIVLFVLHK